MSLRLQIVVFDGFDEIDVFGPYEMLSVPGIAVELATVGGSTTVRSMRGIVIEPETTLDRCDGIIVPGGGWGNRADAGAWGEAQRGDLAARLIELEPDMPWIASVCSGGMLLASAGLLAGRPATTNRSCYDDLRPLVGEVIDERVVDDGNRITAGALFCGADLGLWIIERELGTAAADRAAAGKAYQRQGRVWHSGNHPIVTRSE
ncbi:DJ-1/PfpI family protein [Microlunatus soli]|nr:DJ-1/PfpI family protein [Microlunatus soli]